MYTAASLTPTMPPRSDHSVDSALTANGADAGAEPSSFGTMFPGVSEANNVALRELRAMDDHLHDRSSLARKGIKHETAAVVL